VVVLDLGIAGGVEPVLDALRGDPPVHVILASGARDLPERAAAIGATYLQKPFGPEQLLQALTDVLSS
jgi:DNA-binding response OmpR family regulator